MLERVYYGLKSQRFKMPPWIMSSQFTSQFEPQNIFLNSCYPSGSGMAKLLSFEPVSSTPAGRFTVLGHMAQVAMALLRRFLYLWQHFPANLVNIVFLGIARRALPILEKVKYLKKAGKLKINENDAEKEEKGSCVEHHFLKSHKNYLSEESLVMDGYFGKGTEHPLFNSSNITVNNMYLETEVISELCLVSPTMVFDLGNNWEGYSGKDRGCVTIKSFGHVPPKLLEDTYPEIFTKDLDFCGYLEKTLDCFNPNEKLETTVVPQKLEKNMKSNPNPAICEEQSLTCSLDSPKNEEQPEMNRKGGKNEDTYDVESPTIPSSFQSPLVLSLFYSPLEEEDDSSDGSSEDWWSEDEMEEGSQAKTYSRGNNSGKVENCLEAEDDDSVHQGVSENLCGALSMNNDPFHPLCFSKSIQALKDHTTASQKPKNHQETVVSSYLTRTNSELEELCNLPKQSWIREDQKVASNQETHRCDQPSPRENISPVPAETKLVSQQEIQVKKKVRFSPVVTVHSLVVWDYASRAARRGPWEEMARDRCRFHRRIAQVAAILEPCLAVDHRAKVWKRIHGVPVSLPGEPTDNVPFCSSSARKKELGLQS